MGGKFSKPPQDDPAEHDAGDVEPKPPKNCPGHIDIKGFLDISLDSKSGQPVKNPRLLPIYMSPTIGETDLLTNGAWRLSGFTGGKVKLTIVEGAGLMPVDIDMKKLKEETEKNAKAGVQGDAQSLALKSAVGMPVSPAEKKGAAKNMAKNAGGSVFNTLNGAKANSADPFVRVKPGGSREAFKTKYKEKTMDPIWNQSKTFKVGPAEQNIILEIEDQKTCSHKGFLKFLCGGKKAAKKRSKQNKAMGQATLSLPEFANKEGEVWLPVEPNKEAPSAMGKIKVKVKFEPKLTPFNPRCHPYIHFTEPIRHARVRLVDRTVGMVNWDAVYAMHEPGNLSPHLKGFQGFLDMHVAKKKSFNPEGFIPLYVPEGSSPFPHRYELNITKWPPTGNNVLDFIGRALFYVFADDLETDDWRRSSYHERAEAHGMAHINDNAATHASGEWPGWQLPPAVHAGFDLIDFWTWP